MKTMGFGQFMDSSPKNKIVFTRFTKTRKKETAKHRKKEKRDRERKEEKREQRERYLVSGFVLYSPFLTSTPSFIQIGPK